MQQSIGLSKPALADASLGILQSLPDPHVCVDMSASIVDLNPAAEKLFLRSKQEVVGANFITTLLAHNSQEKCWAQLKRVYQNPGHQKLRCECTAKRPQETFTVEILAAQISLVGKTVMLLSISELAAPQQQSESTSADAPTDLTSVAQPFSAIVRALPDGVIVTDPDQKVTFVNERAEELLQLKAEIACGRPILDVIQNPSLKGEFATSIRDKTRRQFQVAITNKLGLPFVLKARHAPILLANSRAVGTIILLQDVTADCESQKLKDDFLSLATHELRTPLTSIQGYSEILMTRDNLTQSERSVFLRHINQQAIGLAGMINDVVDLSRIESGYGLVVNRKADDLNAVLANATSAYRRLFPGYEFKLTVPNAQEKLMFDRQKIEQVLRNVILNAVKYSNEKSPIEVVAALAENHYIVRITDRGVGMNPEQSRRIFEKFYRGEPTRARGKGAGIGMSVAKHIVEAHGGDIWVQSTQNVGTTVSFTLPRSTPRDTGE